IAAVRSARSRSFSAAMALILPDGTAAARGPWPGSRPPAAVLPGLMASGLGASAAACHGTWHHRWMRAPLRALTVAAAAGGAALGYGSVLDRSWFALRRAEVPVWPAGAEPVRVLHLSDIHLTPGRHRLLSWLRSLD